MSQPSAPTDHLSDESWACPQEGQLALVEALGDRLLASGYRVTIGDYGSAPCVEVQGVLGGALVVVPLLAWAFGEEDRSEEGAWEVALRGADGTFLEVPDRDAPWCCPDIWDVRRVGMDLPAGLRFVEDSLALVRDLSGFVPARRDEFGSVASAVSAYPELPYPGARPSTSYVQDAAGVVRPVHVDAATPSGFAVHDGDRSLCLDAWLAEQGAPPLFARVPVLSYGSNACPSKVAFNGGLGLSLPAVNLRCTVVDVAAVWCREPRGRDDMVPATLARRPGHREEHFVSYVTPQDFEVLDRVEGRPRNGRSAYYDLVVLTCGSVLREDGAQAADVACYVGTGPRRWPLRDAGGHMFLMTPAPPSQNANDAQHLSQHEAQQMVALGLPAHAPAPVGAVVPGDAIPSIHGVMHLFVYGTLMPGHSRWPLLQPFTQGQPRRECVRGRLVDTGQGFPALLPGEDRVPGFVVSLNPGRRHVALELLDCVEGVDGGLFSRALARVGDRLAWTYVGAHPSLRGPIIAQWGEGKMPDSAPSGNTHCHNLPQQEPAIMPAAASSISL